jgi:hypothetical protein
MSYSLTITHDADGVRLEPVSEAALQRIPLGTIIVSGHHVEPGENGSAYVQVSVKDSDGYFIGTSMNASRDRSAEVKAAAKPQD